MSADPSIHDDQHHQGRNQAFYAVQSDDTGAELSELLDQGVEINHQDDRGDTLLHWSIWNRREIATSILLSRNANVNLSNYRQACPWHHICNRYNDPAPLITNFLEHGANPYLKDSQGENLYHKIASHLLSFPDDILNQMVSVLTQKHGFEGWKESNKNGDTALMIAAKKGQSEFPRLIASLEKDELHQATPQVQSLRRSQRL